MTEAKHNTLTATTRTATKKDVAELRKQDIIPGVVYGHGLENQIIQLEKKALRDAYRENGESTLIDLVVDDKPAIPVLIHDMSWDTLTDAIQHVDFFAVNMNEKINAEVVVHFVGIAPAVKDLNGTLVKNRDHIAIKCLPGDLISEVEVYLTSLANFEDSIHISDLQFPEAVEVLDAPELTLATVAPPRTAEEIAALDEDVTEDVEAVEGASEETAEEETKE